MLLGNYTQLNRNAGYDLGAAFSNPLGQFRPTLFPKFYCGDHVVAGQTNKSAFNNGYSGSYAWHQAPKAGGLGSANAVRGAGTFAGAVAGGVNGTAALSGAGSLSGAGALIISMVAALTGAGTISNAAVLAYLNLAASLTGAGDAAGTAKALAHAAAALTASGTLTATPRALGTLAAAITVSGDLLTTSNVADAVLDALIESGMSARQALRLIAAATAGKVSIAGNEVTFRSAVADDRDRIVATVDAGERTAIAYDLDD